VECGMVQKFWEDINLQYIGEKVYVEENENEDADGGGLMLWC